MVASAARLLSHYIHAGALLNSVTKLDRVPVSLKTHAKSWVPGSQFGVVAGPNPQLVKIGPAVEPPSGPEFGTHLLIAKGQSQSDWVHETLAPAWKVQAVQEVTLPSDSSRWWGTGKADRIRRLSSGHLRSVPTGFLRTARDLLTGAEWNSSEIVAGSVPHHFRHPRTECTAGVS